MKKLLNRSGLAQSILGADFITVEEINKARPSIVYGDNLIMALVESLPSEDVLRWCKDNEYVLMPAPPEAYSLLDVRKIQPAHFQKKIGGWYADHEFAHEDKTSTGWLMIKKVPVRNSLGNNWEEQAKLLSALERVPNAVEMSWFITTYFEVRGIRLFEIFYMRTSSLDVMGDCVNVGIFRDEGLCINVWYNNSCHASLGVSAVRKQ